MIPTGRLVALFALPLALGALAIVDPSWIGAMVGADLAILLFALVDALRTRGEVVGTRTFSKVQAAGRPFSVQIHLQVGGGARRGLRVTDDAPGVAVGLPSNVNAGEDGNCSLQYNLTVHRRGAHPFGAVTARWRSPWGLFERQCTVPMEGVVRVYPVFRQLRSWGLVARQDERRAPVRARRRAGGETEFQRLRSYVNGDPYRHVDWKATARKRALITREYGQESNQNVIFLLDAGRVMSGHADGVTLFDRALDAALTMGQVALRHGDRVGLMVYDERVRVWLPPRGGARGGSRLIRATYDQFPSLHEPDHQRALQWLTRHVRRRTLVVVLTAVLDRVNGDQLQAVVRALAGRHLPLVVWIRDPDLEALVRPGPEGEAPDPWQAGAASEILVQRDQELEAWKRRGALVVDAHPDALSSALLARYLEIKARRLL